MEGESIQGLRQIPHPFPLPPGAAPGPLGRRTETVLVVDQPNVTGRSARKRILAEQIKHLGRPLLRHLLQGTPEVLDLLGENPFANRAAACAAPRRAGGALDRPASSGTDTHASGPCRPRLRSRSRSAPWSSRGTSRTH